ncbi:hypothetical protein TREES_T100010828 [Tupaia chinensis]|uniref:Uncharacterized protein n=1 Tax=Tupaia chinensis TaxID=246437 RepID=L9KI30_TUPCH|nr:hypothetical protein TREES_T100010828 [Tupaia chinensis]
MKVFALFLYENAPVHQGTPSEANLQQVPASSPPICPSVQRRGRSSQSASLPSPGGKARDRWRPGGGAELELNAARPELGAAAAPEGMTQHPLPQERGRKDRCRPNLELPQAWSFGEAQAMPHPLQGPKRAPAQGAASRVIRATAPGCVKVQDSPAGASRPA